MKPKETCVCGHSKDEHGVSGCMVRDTNKVFRGMACPDCNEYIPKGKEMTKKRWDRICKYTEEGKESAGANEVAAFNKQHKPHAVGSVIKTPTRTGTAIGLHAKPAPSKPSEEWNASDHKPHTYVCDKDGQVREAGAKAKTSLAGQGEIQERQRSLVLAAKPASNPYEEWLNEKIALNQKLRDQAAANYASPVGKQITMVRSEFLTQWAACQGRMQAYEDALIQYRLLKMEGDNEQV